MRIQITAVGNKMPGWVDTAVNDYVQRMPRECQTEVISVPVAKRGKNAAIERLREQEAEALTAKLPKSCLLIALDERGKPWSTKDLAAQLAAWMQDGRDVALLLGGPDGLTADLRNRAERRWALSAMTLPHGLARVMVAEQLYRAWTLLNGHPYHRE